MVRLLLILFAFTILSCGLSVDKQDQYLLIKHVNVLTMQNDSMLKNRQVLIKNDRIAKIVGPEEIKVPKHTTIINMLKELNSF